MKPSSITRILPLLLPLGAATLAACGGNGESEPIDEVGMRDELDRDTHVDPLAGEPRDRGIVAQDEVEGDVPPPAATVDRPTPVSQPSASTGAFGPIEIERSGAEDVRVGEPFEYRLEVTNTSDMALHQVVVREVTPAGLEILDAEVSGGPAAGRPVEAGYRPEPAEPPQEAPQPPSPAEQQQQPPEQQAQQPQPPEDDLPPEDPDQQAQDPQAREQPSEARQSQEEQRRIEEQRQELQRIAQQQQAAQDSSQTGQQRQPDYRGTWVLGMLEPGDSRTITVRAVAHEQGSLQTCALVEYQPALCTAIEVGAAQLAVALELQAEVRDGLVYACDDLALRFLVRNEGDAASEPVTLHAELPEGLATPEGERQIQEDLGPIEPGEEVSRDLVITPQASGSFEVRTTARVGERELYARTVPLELVRPRLELTLEGPGRDVVERTLGYRAEVRNTGEVPAEDARLTLRIPEQAINPSVSAGGEAQEVEDGVFELGTIEPGQTRTVNVRFDVKSPGNVELAASASATCAEEASDSLATELVGIPAILLEVVDQRDPVPAGETTVYQIRVKNQGSAPGLNVRVRAELPEGFELVQSQGASEVQAEEGKLSFSPIERIEPGSVTGWDLEVRAGEAGHVTFRVEMQSEAQSEPVYELEPTTVF